MPNRYATTAELNDTIERYRVNNDPFVSLSQLAKSDVDKQLLSKISTGEVYLSPEEKEKLWSIVNTERLSMMLASKREKMMGGEFCANKKTTDDWNRQADINSILYYTCPGDDPTISITRENKVSRQAYEVDNPYPSTIPFGLRL